MVQGGVYSTFSSFRQVATFFLLLLVLLLAEDQALLRVFISAARGRLFQVVIVEQFIRVCVWLWVCAALTLSPHSSSPALKYL